MFTMLRSLLLISALSLFQTAWADDFSGKQFNFSTPVAPGSLLECFTPDALTLERLSPKTFEWATTAGLVEKSAISGVSGYTGKVTSKNASSQRTLIIGCWVTQKILTETVNGVEQAYAQGAFRINDALKNSPFMTLPVCKNKKSTPAFVQGDYTIQYENTPTPCATDQWHERLSSLTAMEKETALFALRKPLGKKGYIRDVGW
jgi:hypothetical protein